MRNASMATKCIDQIPPPMVIAAATSHAPCATPRAAMTRAPRSRAVYDAKVATRMESATRKGLWVPVTTIRIVPMLGRDRRIRRLHRAVYCNRIRDAIRRSEDAQGGTGGARARNLGDGTHRHDPLRTSVDVEAPVAHEADEGHVGVARELRGETRRDAHGCEHRDSGGKRLLH